MFSEKGTKFDKKTALEKAVIESLDKNFSIAQLENLIELHDDEFTVAMKQYIIELNEIVEEHVNDALAGKQPEDEQPEDEQPEDEQPEDEQPEDEQPEDEQPEGGEANKPAPVGKGGA